MAHFLDSFLYPQSVAVVGATNNANTLNFNILGNMARLKRGMPVYPSGERAVKALAALGRWGKELV